MLDTCDHSAKTKRLDSRFIKAKAFKLVQCYIFSFSFAICHLLILLRRLRLHNCNLGLYLYLCQFFLLSPCSPISTHCQCFHLPPLASSCMHTFRYFSIIALGSCLGPSSILDSGWPHPLTWSLFFYVLSSSLYYFHIYFHQLDTYIGQTD